MKKAMSLLLALGMLATLLTPCATAEEITAINQETAEAAVMEELAEKAVPETAGEDAPEIAEEVPAVEELTVEEAPMEEITVEETPEEEVASDDAVGEEPAGEVPAEVSAAPGDVAIDATNFPDDNFRKYIEDNIDKDKNKVLSAAEIAGVTKMDLRFKQAQSLKGIEYFSALTDLNCDRNKLTSLDISKNTALTDLSCGFNSLTALDISKNTSLTYLFCYDNKLTELDVSKNTALKQLHCGWNSLKTLDTSKNAALENLTCDDNLFTMLDVSKNTALTNLQCFKNDLHSLDISKNVLLTSIICSETKLTELDISNNTALRSLTCSNNELTSLDISKHTALTYLDCGNNKLTTLDVSKNTALTQLDCQKNELTTLDVSNSPELITLACGKNKLPTLDVSKNPKLAIDSGDLEQTVTFTPVQVNSSWQYNLKDLVGASNVSRVSNVKSDYGTFDAATGIITFAKAPTDATSFSYEYDTKDKNRYMMPVTAKAEMSTVAAFTDRLYSVCLGRLPDAAGKADWVNQLTSYRISGTKAAYGFVFSKEFQGKNYSNADFVEHLYEAFMGRASDAGGKADWVKQLESGKSREEVFYGFANSVEFDKICNSYGIVSKDVETFVTRFYSVCLGRKPDAAGLADWSNQLRSKTRTGRDVAYGFIFSAEFQGKKYSNEDYVEHLYAAFMGRASDAAGKADWVKQLKSGKSREDVFNGFVGSKEFSDICASYDIVRG